METRRETLKIIGAISATCAFPFSANELFGQHVHPAVLAQPQTARVQFFTPSDFEILVRLTDLIIPATETPGAVAAGVPRYIDYVVSNNADLQQTFKGGLEWLAGKRFRELAEEQQIELLVPLSEAVDLGKAETPAEKFFNLVKNLTADGYYTSQIGLVKELGYKGNTVLAKFPECEHPEHHGSDP